MADVLPNLAPIMLCGLTWDSAKNTLSAVDCALRRPHWCSPVVILSDGKLTLDDDGDLSPLKLIAEERRANDWMMVPRVDDEGNKVEPAFRAKASGMTIPIDNRTGE